MKRPVRRLPSRQDRELAAIEREWLRLHQEAFRGRQWLVRVMRIRTTVTVTEAARVVSSQPNAHGQWRPAAEWDCEVEHEVEVETTVRIQVRIADKPARRRGRIRLAA